MSKEIADKIRSSEKYQNKFKDDDRYEDISEILKSNNHFI